MIYQEKDVKYETDDFWVFDAGKFGFEVYQKGITHSTRVARIGLGTSLGLPRVIEDTDRLQAAHTKRSLALAAAGLDRAGLTRLRSAVAAALEPFGWLPFARTVCIGDPPIASKSFQTAVGPQEAIVWLGDVRRVGAPAIYGQYASGQGNALEDLWIPASAFLSDIQAHANLFAEQAEEMVYATYAAGLRRSSRVSVALAPDAYRHTCGLLMAAQATHYAQDDAQVTPASPIVRERA